MCHLRSRILENGDKALSTATFRHRRAPRTSGGPFIPTLVVDNTNEHLTHDDGGQSSGGSSGRSPRIPWQHAVVGTFGVGLAGFVLADWIRHLYHPVTSSILRTTAVGVIVVFVMLRVAYRLYLRLETLVGSMQALYKSMRDIASWFEARASVIDERDVEFHTRLDSLAEGRVQIQRGVAQLHQVMLLLHNDQVDLASDLGYSHRQIRSIFQQISSLSGGQSSVYEAVDHLGHTVRQIAARLNGGGGDSGETETSEVRRAYLQAYGRGDPDGDAGVVIPLHNKTAFELGREVERRKWQRGEGGEENT